MEAERWLSRKRSRRGKAPDIRDFISVHGVVVKSPHRTPSASSSKAQSSSLPTSISRRQAVIGVADCRKARVTRSTAFAYTAGVRKKAASECLKEMNHPARTDACTVFDGVASSVRCAVTKEVVTRLEPNVDLCLASGGKCVGTRDALAPTLAETPRTPLEVTDGFARGCTGGLQESGLIVTDGEPSFIDTEELLKELATNDVKSQDLGLIDTEELLGNPF